LKDMFLIRHLEKFGKRRFGIENLRSRTPWFGGFSHN